MSLALEMCFGIPLFVGYVVSSLVVIPLVTHGITFISRFQLWTQPIWVVLHLLPFAFIAATDLQSFANGRDFRGTEEVGGQSFNLILFGAASTVAFSLIAQIGEQVDFLRFLPPRERTRTRRWWLAYLSAGPGWIIPGMLKLLAGSFLAFLADRASRAAGQGRRADADVSGRVPLRVLVAGPGAGLHRRVRDRLADQDQRHQRLCRLDRLVELLFAPDAQPSRAAWSGWCSTSRSRCC